MSKEFIRENLLETSNDTDNYKNGISGVRSLSINEENDDPSISRNLGRVNLLLNENHVSPAAENFGEEKLKKPSNFELSSKIMEDREENDETGGHVNQNEDLFRIPYKKNRHKKVDANRKKCGSSCVCKMKQAVALIVEEMKKVDGMISVLGTEGTCPYTPSPSDKKEFAKSVQKNASVCHLIIEELKNQRMEINEMLRWYNVLKDDFVKLESTLNQQKEEIQHIEATLKDLEETVKTVRKDINKRHENFLDEMKTKNARTETREQILETFVEWISSLNAKRNEEKRQFDMHLENVISERNEDRMMLTLAIKQLQEVRRIETLMNLEAKKGRQNDTKTQQQALNSRRATFCTCRFPINHGYTNSIDNRCRCKYATQNCSKKANPVFDLGITHCAGGADVSGTTQHK